MTKLEWDKIGERLYETGVDHGVLYLPDNNGEYVEGFAWNGLTTVTESPSGAEPTPMYADNIKYLNVQSREEFSATVEAYTYPEEFAECDGTARPAAGIALGQQPRRLFGLSFRTNVGNDLEASNFGYKIHLVYGALAAPSERAYATINDSPEAISFSWELSTSEVNVTGYKPTALVTVDSTQVDPAKLAALEAVLYGSAGVDPRLPLPDEVISLAGTATVEADPTGPTYVSGTHTITIPAVTGVDYKIDGVVQAAGPVVITKDTVVTATPKSGYRFPAVTDDDWLFKF